ncbi:MAG: DeoR/GlpR transcriptional regulator [Tyzzerella sp.]|nr:DeoR/GlpR transcriptional regulator [Tyzzerella sp.]
MLQYERQQLIVEYLKQTSIAKIGELAKHLYTSEASIRRDIASLEAVGIVERVYGGVILCESKNEVSSATARMNKNDEAKNLIAQKAAELIHDGDTIIFDNSSTVRNICKHIKKRQKLKIITNNLQICTDLQDTDITVYCTGGEYYKKRAAFLGPYAEEFLRSVHADSLFFSCKGLSKDGILSDVSELEIFLRKLMIKQADKAYCLCDSSKLDTRYAFKLCDAEDLTDIICDKPLPEFVKL